MKKNVSQMYMFFYTTKHKSHIINTAFRNGKVLRRAIIPVDDYSNALRWHKMLAYVLQKV